VREFAYCQAEFRLPGHAKNRRVGIVHSKGSKAKSAETSTLRLAPSNRHNTRVRSVPNSGNTIGNGWQNFKILTAASGVLLGVEPNGDLRWYSYQGNGTHDPSGNTGWHPNSRNIIGRGWTRFTRIVGGPDDRGRQVLFFWTPLIGQPDQLFRRRLGRSGSQVVPMR
jgi:hypothetical protein